MNKIDLSGRKAVVTGAARGIGLAIAERFDDYGLMYEIFGRVAGWGLLASPARPAASWPMAGSMPPADAGGRVLAASDTA